MISGAGFKIVKNEKTIREVPVEMHYGSILYIVRILSYCK